MNISADTMETIHPWLRPVTIWLVITVMLVLANAFGVSTAFGFAGALSFWTGLVGANMAGWLAWRRWTPGDTMTHRQFVMGAVLLNGLLAIEVASLYRLYGRTDATIGWKPFVYGLLVTLFVAYLRQTGRARRPVPVKAAQQPAGDAALPIPIVTAGILARGGIADPADLLSVRAEDHYCRLSLRNRGSVLTHYRFRDAVSDLAHLEGAQIHRSAWVADHAVAGAERDGRRWSLRLTDGTSVPVSETSVTLCRARGWLRTPDGLA